MPRSSEWSLQMRFYTLVLSSCYFPTVRLYLFIKHCSAYCQPCYVVICRGKSSLHSRFASEMDEHEEKEVMQNCYECIFRERSPN